MYSRPSVRQTTRPPVAAVAVSGLDGRGAGTRSVNAPLSKSWVLPERRRVDRKDLVEADLDLVAVKHGGRIGAQPDPVDQELHAGLGGADGGGALCRPLEHRVQWLDSLAFEVNGALRAPTR